MRHQGGQFFGGAHHAHSASAAAGRGLEHHRIADAFGHFKGLFGALQNAARAGEDGHAGLLHRGARHLLQPHAADDLGRGSDEAQAGGFAHFGEIGIL